MSSSGSFFFSVDAEKTLTSSFPSSILIDVIVSSLALLSSVIVRCFDFVDAVDTDDGELTGDDVPFFFMGV